MKKIASALVAIIISFTSYSQANVILPHDSTTVADTTFNPDDEVFVVSEVSPEYPGGQSELLKFIQQNLRYPDMARENEIQGTVYASFIIEKSGRVNDVKIIRGIGGGCDEETWRFLKKMPAWKPGMQNGKLVRCSMFLPIKFDLGKSTTASDSDMDFAKTQKDLGDEYHYYDLGGRTAKYLPRPIGSFTTEGTVVVTIYVDRQGIVTRAISGAKGTTTADGKLRYLAEQAASKARFSSKNDAPEEQKGTITYIFEVQ